MRIRHFLITNFNLPRGFGGRPRTVPDEAWMERRMEIFERFCAPSVAGQRERRFRWLLRFDPATAPAWLDRVRRLDANAEVLLGPLGERIQRDVESGEDLLIMSRLDNDDALHADFVGYVRSRADGSTKVIDVKGYQLDVRDGRRDLYLGKYIATHRHPTPFLSLSTPARAGFPLVDAHPHQEMARHFPVDACDRLYFLQIIHGTNASNRIVGRPCREPVDLAAFGLRRPARARRCRGSSQP